MCTPTSSNDMAQPPGLADAVPTLEASLKEISRLVKDPSSDLDEAELPGLYVLIDEWYDPEVENDKEDFMRGILDVFQNSTHKEAYNDVLSRYDQPQQDAINAFVSGQASAFFIRVEQGVPEHRRYVGRSHQDKHDISKVHFSIAVYPISVCSSVRNQSNYQ